MSVNSVMLVGRLGATPETRTTTTGKSMCTFNVATDRWDSTKSEKVADWHRVVAWEKTAENCVRYLTTGSQVAVEGRLCTRTYDDKEGRKVWKTEVIAQRVTFLGKSERQRADEPSDGAFGGRSGGRVGAMYGGRPSAMPTAAAPLTAMDDLPF
ncbi:MAG: single-stranded DNA-binding protein [Deltaproteobacteria bacterium]|nr:single-stranded DNA-binding protein [Deltaproteobacteria bacterium]